MKKSHLLAPLLAGATLLLLGANAVPSVERKHLLQTERRRLERELREEQAVARRLAAEVDALVRDPFYLERLLVETWKGVPQGAIPFVPPVPGQAMVRSR